MKVLLRSLFLVCVTNLLLIGCGEKEALQVEASPTTVKIPVAVPVTPVSESAEPSVGGGYEPTAEERVPGITLDAAAVDAAMAAASTVEAAPVTK